MAMLSGYCARVLRMYLLSHKHCSLRHESEPVGVAAAGAKLDGQIGGNFR